jgi:hypothetical protein
VTHELERVMEELRRLGEAAVADELDVAERGGATGTEVLCRVGSVLDGHRPLRSRLSESGRRAWDSVMSEVHRAFPGWQFTSWWGRMSRAFRTSAR